MTKRKSKKSTSSRSKKPTAMTDTSSSTVSLSSAPGAHRHSYRWRYLQLIKDGLIWLTGKRTRSIRISASDTSNAIPSSASAAKKGKKPVRKQLCFKVGLPRGKSKHSAKTKKHGGPKSSCSKRKGLVCGGGGRKGCKGKPKRTSRPKVASWKRSPKRSRSKTRSRGRPPTGCGPSKRLASTRGRPRTKAAIGGGRRMGRGAAAPKRGPAHKRVAAAHKRGTGPRSQRARTGGSQTRKVGRKPRTSCVVTRSVSRLALSKRAQPMTRPISPVREPPRPILLN